METKTPNHKQSNDPTQRPKRGGKRPGAGRPLGSGRYREPTTLVRVPNSMMPGLTELLLTRVQEPSMDRPASNDSRIPFPSKSYTFDETITSVEQVAEHPAHPIKVPLYESRVAAGFPSPASEYEEGRIDLNTLLVRHPAATFLVRVQGDSMLNVGIHPGDLLIVDRSLQAVHGRIIVAVVDGELTVKRLSKEGGQVVLMPENPAFPPMPILEHQDFMIWGVVTNVVHGLG
jgi:DNA polymerase V